MGTVRALYAENQSGVPIPQGKRNVDLIFARRPAEQDEEAESFKVFNGRELVSIHHYLKKNPRPDLVDLEERMKWLGDGPYGGRAGGIVGLAKASSSIPIQDRYYFATTTPYLCHCSPGKSDRDVAI